VHDETYCLNAGRIRASYTSRIRAPSSKGEKLRLKTSFFTQVGMSITPTQLVNVL